MSRPLDGITVVSLEHAVAAPFCTRQLADLGAQVIKIERPGSGDFARHYDQRVRGEASYFVWINRGKKSLTLDLKHPDGREVLNRLLSTADILVQNLAPGATTRMGLGADDLREQHPRLIVCDISGYGDNGPYRDKKAYDLLIQAEAGLLSVTGTPDEVVRAGISVADIAAGMYAYSSILAALIQRGRTGKGSRIDVSMLEALTEWMGNPLYYGFEGQAPAPRSGASHPSIYPYGPFQAGDGRTVLFGLQNEREWATFCQKVLQEPAFLTDARYASNALRNANRAALRSDIEKAFSSLTAQDVTDRLDDAGIGNASVNNITDLWNHPQLAARQAWVNVPSAAGLIPAMRPPGRNDSFEHHMGAVPALGEHTALILQELGFPSESITRMRQEGAI
jgi:itaconate CoA-transferase